MESDNRKPCMKAERVLSSEKKRKSVIGILAVARGSLEKDLGGWVHVGDVWYASGKKISKSLIYGIFRELGKVGVVKPWRNYQGKPDWTTVNFTCQGLKKLNTFIEEERIRTSSIPDESIRKDELYPLEITKELLDEVRRLLNCP